MRVQTVISAVALSAAMTFSGAAFAQTSLGGVEVLAADLPAVQERCDALANAKATQSISSDTAVEDSADKAQDASTAADTDTSIESVPALTASGTTTFDLETVTLDNCVAAGLVK